MSSPTLKHTLSETGMDIFLSQGQPHVPQPHVLPPPPPSKKRTPVPKKATSSSKKKTKTAQSAHEPPTPFEGGIFHTAFTPLPPEVNIPEGAAADASGRATYASCHNDELEDDDVEGLDQDRECEWEEYTAEELAGGVAADEDADSWGQADDTYDAGTDGGASDVEDDLSSGMSPTNSAGDSMDAFIHRHRRLAKEQRVLYSGPQLMFDDDDV